MRRTAVTSLVALVMGLTVTLTAAPASACTCMFDADEVAIDDYDVVFFGAIVDEREDADTDVWLVRVDGVVKGDPASFVTVETARGTAECGIEIPADENAVFFVNDNLRFPSGEYAASLCSPTRTITATDTVLADRPVTTPSEADPEIFSAFEAVVVDAPDAVEEVSDVPAEEEPVIDDDVEVVSERDQAELAAAGQETEGAVLLDGPGITDGEDGLDTTAIVVGALIGVAAVVGLLELRRRRTLA